LEYGEVQQPSDNNGTAELEKFLRKSPPFDVTEFSSELKLPYGVFGKVKTAKRLLENVGVEIHPLDGIWKIGKLACEYRARLSLIQEQEVPNTSDLEDLTIP
jgi:hypothetical protein